MWLGCTGGILLQLHFCCSLLPLDDIHNLKNIWMWFSHNLLQAEVPAFNMIVCSGPIVVVVVPLLESELAIDPGAVKVCDEVFCVVCLLWGFGSSGHCSSSHCVQPLESSAVGKFSRWKVQLESIDQSLLKIRKNQGGGEINTKI